MSQREDRKLQQVRVASYNYRHEAEFAAGFLKDAGIPYRLQIEDPTLGLSASDAATLWVAAVDERRARAVLDHEKALEDEEDGRSRGAPGDPEGHVPRPGAGVAATASRPSTPRTVDTSEARSPARPSVDLSKPKPDLTLRERLIAIGGSVVTASLLGIEAVREAPSPVTLAIALLAAGLAIVGVHGKAPDVLARILAALSGDAP